MFEGVCISSTRFEFEKSWNSKVVINRINKNKVLIKMFWPLCLHLNYIIKRFTHLFSAQINIWPYKNKQCVFYTAEGRKASCGRRIRHSVMAGCKSRLLIHYNFSKVSHKGLSVELVYRNFSKQKTKGECILLPTIYSSYIKVGRLTSIVKF